MKKEIIFKIHRHISLWGLGLMIGVMTDRAQTSPVSPSTPPQTLYASGITNLQQALDDAPPNSVVVFNPNEQLILSNSLNVNKALTLRGLNARLPEKLGKSPLVTVQANGVTIEDFQLYGNTESVGQDERAPLIYIKASDFRVQHGLVVNSSRHGIYAAPDEKTGDLYGGVIRDIVGHGNARCVVSIGDHGNQGLTVHNVLIENIRSYDSALRGAVNVKDGNDNIIVRDIYASNSVYAVDIQDHKRPGEINRNITIENIYAIRCRHAIRTNNRDVGHHNLTIRNVTAEQCSIPLRISNTERVTLDNIRVLDHDIQIGVPFPLANNGQPVLDNGEKLDHAIRNLERPDPKINAGAFPPVFVFNCQGVSIRDVVVKNSNYNGPALALVDSGDVIVDGFTLQGESNALSSGVKYIITTNRAFSSLSISHVSARHVKEGGIVLESKTSAGTLSDYLVSDNLAEVVDLIHGKNSLVVNNISESPDVTAQTKSQGGGSSKN